VTGQEQLIEILLRIFLISGFCSIAGWVGTYTWMGFHGAGKWWRNPVGRSLVIKSALLGLLLVPSILSLFFKFSRQTSDIAGWVDTGLIALITPVMWWRVRVWVRLHKAGRLPSAMEVRVAELTGENARLLAEVREFRHRHGLEN
jgi:hypothetical protein